jgi:hypothetical protein
MKKTLHTEIEKIVPIFATRWHSISKILHQLRQVDNPDKIQYCSLIPKKPFIHTPAINLQKILKKPRQNRQKNLELCNQKTTNAQNLTSFSKINSNKKPFRTLNHHHTMKMALIKTNLRTKLSTSNQQQPTTKRGQRNGNRKKRSKN